MSKFNSIDTAPKDGTRLLLQVKDDIAYPGRLIATEGWWDAANERWRVVWLSTHGCGCCGHDCHKPVGWMALPEAA